MNPAKETFVPRNPETGAITGYPRECLLAKLPMKTDHVSALDWVHIELAVAAELLENGDDDGRRGIQRAMIALLNYFPAVGLPQAALRPILKVAEAVLDVDNGRQPAAFKAKRAGGRPGTTLQASIAEGQMAAILECCVRHEKAKGTRAYLVEASRLASQLLRSAGYGKHLTPAKLRALREEATAGEKDSPIRTAYEALLPGDPGIDPLEHAKGLLRPTGQDRPSR